MSSSVAMLARSRTCTRCLHTTRILQSYIGSTPVSVPNEVSILDPVESSTSPRTIQIKGPKGDLALKVPRYLSFTTKPSNSGSLVTLKVDDARVKEQRAMWGTTRALFANMITGVTEGFTVSLRFVGVGYRAAIEKDTVVLRVGFSKPVVLNIPDGATARCPIPTSLILEGRSKEVLTQFAAVIRSYRKPEPYKGKGIFVNDEKIKIKAAAGKK